MVAWVGLAVLAMVFAAQLRIDAAYWGTRATPGVLLTGGYTAIAAVYAIASLSYDFNPIVPETYLFLAIMGILVIVTSVLTNGAVGWNPAEAKRAPTRSGSSLRLLLLVALAGYGIVAYRVAGSSGGLWSGESREYLSSGLLGHAGVLLSFILIWYAVSTMDRRLVRVPMFVLGVLVMSFNPVKGWTVIPMVAVALAEASRSRNGKTSVRPLLLAGLGGVTVFFVIYLSRAMMQGVDSALLAAATREVFAHLLFYITAGLFGLNAVVGGLRLPGGAMVLLAPFANSVSVVTGDPYVPIISDVYVVGLLGHGDGGNVYSMYGALVAQIGLPLGIFSALVIVAMTYLLFAWTWRSRHAASRVAALYFTAVLAFGWFEYYLWHLTPYEILLYSVCVVLLVRTLSGVSHESRDTGSGQLNTYPAVD